MKDPRKPSSWLMFFTGALVSVGIAGLVAAFIHWLRRRTSDVVEEPVWDTPTQLSPEIQGLTEEEAQARLLADQDNPARSETEIPIKQIIHNSVFTIFNLSLIGVAIAQFLFSRPWDALLSLLVSVLAISISVVQQVFVEKRLKVVEDATRPRAIVLRDGKTRGIDPAEIVRGDVLFVGPGDQFLANGELISEKPVIVDQPLIIHETSRLMKERGDPVDTGSYCVSSRAAYRVDSIGDDRLLSKTNEDETDSPKAITPLEKIIDGVMRVLLASVLIMILVLAAQLFRFDEAVGMDADVVINAVSVIFSLAPASLYFMVFLTYLVNTAQLVKHGALVRQARSVEALAEATDLCITRAGIERGTTINLQLFPSSAEHPMLNETYLRQILGDFARSCSSTERAIVAIRETFPGEKRDLVAEAPYLSAYRWAAVSVDDEDLRGIYVLGDPVILQANLIPVEEQGEDQEEVDEPQEGAIRRGLHSIGSFFRRGKPSEEDQAEGKDQSAEISEQVAPDQPQVEKKGRLQNWFGNVRNSFQRENEPVEQPGALGEVQDQPIAPIEYLFAYVPDVVPLFDESGYPQLPDGLIPLSSLHYSSEAHPETIETLKALAVTGINIRIFSKGSADQMLPLVEKAGIHSGEALQERVISGSQLVDEEPESFYQSIEGKSIFSESTPEIERRVVEAIDGQGESAVVAGDRPDDLPAMQQAALTVAWQSSIQAAHGGADIVLLEKTLKPLLEVLERGQQCVHGLVDILKLYLTQLLYLFLLLVLFWVADLGVPYLASQGGFIALVTLTIPSMGLSLWATTGVLPRDQIRRRLSQFVVPAALTIFVAAFLVFRYFLDLSGDVAYAQLALTHFLVISGLLVVLLVRPPMRFLAEEEDRTTDRRLITLVFVLFILYMLFAMLPMAYTFFKISHLEQPIEYLAIAVAVLGWLLAFLVIRFLLRGESILRQKLGT